MPNVLSVIFDVFLCHFEARLAQLGGLGSTDRLVRRFAVRSLLRNHWRGLQWLRLQRTLRYAATHSPFYRRKFREVGFEPWAMRSLADFEGLPFTTSIDLQSWRDFLAVPESRMAYAFTSAGTTGEPKRSYFTAKDMNALINISALGLRLLLPDRLVVLIALPTGLWIGMHQASRVVERAGGLALPVGQNDPRRVLAELQRFEANVVITSPSFMVALTSAAEAAGYRPQLEAIICGGEALTVEHAERFHAYWGAPIYDSYGMTEIGGAQAMTLPGCPCLHLNGLQLFTEIVDPNTGRPAHEGELVFTPLLREAMPLIRYRSGDLARWGECDCELSFGSVVLLGRTDDMFVAGDMNFYGHVLAEAAGGVPGATGRVEVVVERVDLIDRLRIRVEGRGVSEVAVRERLFAVYPDLPTCLAIGNLTLVIEVDVALEGQIKAARLIDRRRAGIIPSTRPGTAR